MKNVPGSIRRSGGPRSEAGKAAAASNALKSGIYSRHAFIDGEDKREFETLRAFLYDDLAPQTLIQHALAEDVLAQLWRKFRLERYASKKLEELSEREVTSSELLLELGVEMSQIIEKARRLNESVRKNGVKYYQDWVAKAQLIREKHPRFCEDLEGFKREYPEAYQLMRKYSWRGDRFDDLVIENEKDDSGRTFWEQSVKQLEDFGRDWLACLDSEEKLLIAIPRIQQNRIYRHLIDGKGDRASEEVTRALHRALAAYYKEQERYRKDTAILIDGDQPDERDSRELEEVADIA